MKLSLRFLPGFTFSWYTSHSHKNG